MKSPSLAADIPVQRAAKARMETLDLQARHLLRNRFAFAYPETALRQRWRDELGNPGEGGPALVGMKLLQQIPVGQQRVVLAVLHQPRNRRENQRRDQQPKLLRQQEAVND